MHDVQEVAELVHESPFILLLLQSMKDIAIFIERESLVDDEKLLSRSVAALQPGDLASPRPNSAQQRADPHKATANSVVAPLADGSGDVAE